MNAKRADATNDADDDFQKNGHGSASLGQTEALDLLAQLEQDLASLRAFVDAEKNGVKRKPPSPKRLARLRLVSEDITSAVKLSTKPAKN